MNRKTTIDTKTSPKRHPNRIPRILSASIATALAAVCLSSPVHALPVGGQAVAGQASISSTDKTMTVNVSDRSILNFTKFNIAADESLKFVQPSATSTVLARATDGTPSEILGRMDANGRVVLANSAGIFFGSGSVISVGNLVAAAGTISDDDFLKNGGKLSVNLTGSVENAGQITAGEGVALLGRTVSNTGSIVAPNGLVAMVSGENVVVSEEGGDVAVVQNIANAAGSESALSAELQLAAPKEKTSRAAKKGAAKAPSDSSQAAVTQAGAIRARSVYMGAGDLYAIGVKHTGQTTATKSVRVDASTKVVVSGGIDASQQNQNAANPVGSITISGESVELAGATLSARGDVQGGEISVFGKDVTVVGAADGASLLDVSGVGKGNGGSIWLSGGDSLSVDGILLARGGEVGGDGGRITLQSNQQVTQAATLVADVSAPAGQEGTFTVQDSLDPIVDPPIKDPLADSKDPAVERPEDPVLVDPNLEVFPIIVDDLVGIKTAAGNRLVDSIGFDLMAKVLNFMGVITPGGTRNDKGIVNPQIGAVDFGGVLTSAAVPRFASEVTVKSEAAGGGLFVGPASQVRLTSASVEKLNLKPGSSFGESERGFRGGKPLSAGDAFTGGIILSSNNLLNDGTEGSSKKRQ